MDFLFNFNIIILLMLISFLVEYHRLILGAHLVGVALGLGGATITDILFFKFIKNKKISPFESKVLKTLSQVIWFALGILILSGVGLYLPYADRLNGSPKFLVKMIAVAVIILNGLVLNFVISPKISKISSSALFRRLAFASGAISIVSWYSAFILGMMRSKIFSFGELLGIYIALLTLAVAGSQIFERRLARRALK